MDDLEIAWHRYSNAQSSSAARIGNDVFEEKNGSERHDNDDVVDDDDDDGDDVCIHGDEEDFDYAYDYDDMDDGRRDSFEIYADANDAPHREQEQRRQERRRSRERRGEWRAAEQPSWSLPY